MLEAKTSDLQAQREDGLNYHSLSVRPGETHPSRQFLPYRQFSRMAGLYADKPALILPEQVVTYRELLQTADILAAGLIGLGFQAGHLAAIQLGSCWEQIPIFLAVARIGGVHAGLSVHLSDEEFAREISELAPRLIIGSQGVSIQDVMAASLPSLPPFSDEEQPLVVRFSSGSTGRPKKMLASHRAQALLYSALTTELQLTDRDIHLAVGSFAHATLQVGLAQLMVGGTVVARPFDRRTFWRDCQDYSITNAMVVPTMISAALEYPGQITRPIRFASMGAALAMPLQERLAHRFPTSRLFDFYAATEFGFLTCLRPEDRLTHPSSVGRPYFGQDVAIFDNDGLSLPVGEIGNIYGRGPICISSYIGAVQPLPVPTILKEQGWVISGDLGYLDEQGFLHVSDRRADLIVIDDIEIFPSEVELIIRESEAVREVAVIGVADTQGQHRICAYIEGSPPEGEIQRLCYEKLEPHQMPANIFLVEALPRTSSGKISRHLLRRLVSTGSLPS
jgi:acyl-coenzyme A synthetase/AMP-(fatty) acid ligase